MATIAEQLTSLANTKTAIKDAIVAKGVSVADTDTFASYADKIGQIETGGGGGEVVNKTKLGLTIDDIFGDVGADGTLGAASGSAVVDFSGVNKIVNSVFRHKFFGMTNIASVLAPSLTTVGSYGLLQAFNSCTGLKSVVLSSLQTVESNGLQSTFNSCYGLESIALESLKTVGSNGMQNACSNTNLTSVSMESLQTVGANGLYSAFSACSKLESVNLNSLQTVESRGLASAFSFCKALTSMSFPSLTSVVTDSFGTTSAALQMFYQCTGLTEIHFRADMQAAIEATNGYANKWGATNATIYFDL